MMLKTQHLSLFSLKITNLRLNLSSKQVWIKSQKKMLTHWNQLKEGWLRTLQNIFAGDAIIKWETTSCLMNTYEKSF